MMPALARHPRLIIAGVVVVVLLLGIWVISSSTSNNTSTVSLDANRETALTSPFTSETDSQNLDVVTSTGDPNYDAVFQPFTLFNPNTLPIPSKIQYRIHEDLTHLINEQITPTYTLTYAQIDRRTVKCATEYDCSLSFYIDSPERYFSYHTYLAEDGSEVSTLKQEPMPGTSQ